MFVQKIFAEGENHITIDTETAAVNTAQLPSGTELYDTPQFISDYTYDGELGNFTGGDATTFKLWAPTAERVNLLIYDEAGNVTETWPMYRQDKGVFSYSTDYDLTGTRYRYEVTVNGRTAQTVDPYAKAVSLNGMYSVVFAPRPTPAPLPNFGELKLPIIYELHVRDYSILTAGGMKNRGKFLAMTETGTHTADGQITGLDYLKSLGITHVQLMPIFDFSSQSVDEAAPETKYNWGYDPLNFNAVEGAYSTRPADPFNRIFELQKLIDCLHANGIKVIMDVVYNHVFQTGEHAFDKIVPGYYFRTGANGEYCNGTGCGNEIASERPMVRKYIVDSIIHWLTTYKLDGFRFDLMGILDIRTMQEIYREACIVNPDIFILGEGWDMGFHPQDDGANQRHADKLAHIAFFNDNIRDLIRGDNSPSHGFVNDGHDLEAGLMNGVRGGQNCGRPYLSAAQVVQYVAAHDNYTLYDQLKKTLPSASETELLRRSALATSILLLSFGTPFLHAGQEWGRTKQGASNSYNLPDSINGFDWQRVQANAQLTDFIRGIIKLRKHFAAIFNLTDYQSINRVFSILMQGYGCLAYRLNLGEDAATMASGSGASGMADAAGAEDASPAGSESYLYIAHNVGKEPIKNLPLPNGKYKVLVNTPEVNLDGLGEMTVEDGFGTVPPLATLVLLQQPETTQASL